MVKPLLLVSKPKPQALERGLSVAGRCVTLPSGVFLNFRRLLEKFHLWMLLSMKWNLTIFQTGWEPHQRVTQPAEKWERPLGACGFALTLSSDCTFKSTNCIKSLPFFF